MDIYIYDSIPSTNDKLWELIDQGISLPCAAFSISQTAGRGQWGRTWLSDEGGLYLSLGIDTNLASYDAPHLTLFSAWGIAETLRRQNIPVLLKWPNDLILEGRKLGGIKTETRVKQGRISKAVIGVGINWSNSPPAMGINLESFFEAIPTLEKLRNLVLEALLEANEKYLSEGIEKILPSYENLLSSKGRAVVVDGCPGIVKGVTADGKLRVRLHSVGAGVEICLQPGKISLGYD